MPASPTDYTRYRDYSQFQSDNPDTDLNGTDLDTDFDRIKVSIDQANDALGEIRRADGALVNTSVGVDQLKSEVVTLIGNWVPRGDWLTATVFAARDIVSQSGFAYVCLVVHTSGVFATDLAAAKWMRLGSFSSASSVTFAPAGGVAATDVQAAIVELDGEKQPIDATLTALAGVSTAANKLIYATGSDAFATTDLTAAARTVLDDASTAAMLSTLEALPLAGGTMTGAIVLPGNPSTALQAAPKQYVDAIAGSAVAGVTPGGRLTLTSGLSVTVSDVLAATSIYYTPHNNDLVPIYDGSSWVTTAFSELTLPLNSNAGHAGYHQADKNFDCFVFSDAGTLRLATGPAWTDATTRSAAIARKNGRWTNSASITLRWGTGTNDTSTVAANLALYVGTFRTNASNGQTEDSHAKRFVWNMHNRVPRAMRGATETADSWSYNSTTARQANANTANQLDMVRGLDEDAVGASVSVKWANSTVGESGIVQIGLDSTTTMATGCIATNPQCQVANLVMVSQAEWRGLPGIGRRFLAWLEKGTGAGGTQTWSGDGGAPTSFQSGITGWGMA